MQRAWLSLVCLFWAAGAQAQASGPEQRTGGAEVKPPLKLQLADLQRRLTDLKEALRASHRRLAVLQDDMRLDERGAARLELGVADKLGALYRLQGLTVVLDRVVQLRSDDPRELARISPIASVVPAGAHTVQVVARLAGRGLPYLEAYRFELRGSCSFTAPASGKTVVRVDVYQRTGALLPYEERPALRCKVATSR